MDSRGRPTDTGAQANTAANHAAHPRQVLADMLGVSLGAEVARANVDAAAQQLGLGAALTRREALRVLEQIALNPGIAAIAARFVMSRVHLVWGAETSSGT